MNPKVSVIVLNLNQEGHTRECIKSLQEVTYDPVDIILIDNGSTDGSGPRLRAEFPSVCYHRNEVNLGFSGGNNTGIRIAFERGCDYIMLLNNDTIVEKDFIQPLVEHASKNPRTGFQSCKIYLYSDQEAFWYAGGTLNIHKALSGHRGMFEKDRGQYDVTEETGLATGCMMIASKDLIREIGIMDETLFCYFEDADWCMRASLHGYRNIYNPKARIWHKVSVTSKIDSPFYLYFTMRNKIYFLRKYSSPGKWFVHLPYFIYFYGRHLIRMSLKWHSYIGTKAVIIGLIDGLRHYNGDHGKGHLDDLLK